jgi:hypothetical protein
MTDLLRANLLSPIPLAFALGVAARLARSEFSLPRDVYTALSIYLLFALGLKGGVELAHAGAAAIALPAAATVALGCLTPVTAYLVLRRLGRFSTSDAAAIAAHYGSVSAVTFIAAQQFAAAQGAAVEGFMPTLLTLLESPGIHIALAIGAVQRVRAAAPARTPAAAVGAVGVTAGGAAVLGGGDGLAAGALALGGPAGGAPGAGAARDRGALAGTLHEVFTGRTMVLLVGGLLVGWLMGERGWQQVQPFFDAPFKGALTLFILEMGVVAGARLGDLRRVGPFLLAFAVLVPVAHGALGVLLGHWAGLSVGGCTVLGAMAASASYIAAPPAVRAQLPEANPTYYLTASLAMTFPFNLLLGIPLYHQLARLAAGA